MTTIISSWLLQQAKELAETDGTETEQAASGRVEDQYGKDGRAGKYKQASQAKSVTVWLESIAW